MAEPETRLSNADKLKFLYLASGLIKNRNTHQTSPVFHSRIHHRQRVLNRVHVARLWGNEIVPGKVPTRNESRKPYVLSSPPAPSEPGLFSTCFLWEDCQSAWLFKRRLCDLFPVNILSGFPSSHAWHRPRTVTVVRHHAFPQNHRPSFRKREVWSYGQLVSFQEFNKQ